MKKVLSILTLFIVVQSACANMYHLKVLSDKVPDLSNIETFGKDIGDKWQTNNEKAIILNYWIAQLTTYNEPLYYSRQWDDPIAFLNNNEYGMCSDMTLLMNAMGEGAFGFTGRRHELSELNTPIEHTVPEIEYDGILHLFDPSFGFAYGHHDNGIVTSMEDYALNPYFSRNNTPTALTRDSDGAGYIKAWLSADIFGWSIDRFRYDEYSPDRTWIEKKTEGYYGVHRFDISIEDYEYYTRYWSHLDGLEDFTTHDFYWPHYNYNDVDNYSWNDNDHGKAEHRGNGLWVYEPDLTDSSAYESSEKVSVSNAKIYPTQLNVEGSIVFKIDAANFITGVLIEADIVRETATDSVIIEASSSGGNYWFPVWEDKAVGDLSIKENISDMIKGTLQSQDLRHVTGYLVRVRFNTGSGLMAAALKSIKISTVTMLGKSSLPKLMLGSNEITVGEANNHALYQTKTLNPVLTKLENGINDEISWVNIEAWKLYAKDHKNLAAIANYGNIYTGLEKNHWEEGWVTYELDAPRAIKTARLGGSFIVRENSQDKFVIKYRVFNGAWSGWQEVATYDWSTRNNSDKRENQTHLEAWDIVQENVTKVQFRTEVLNYAHIEALHMEIDYEAKVTPLKPLYITYNWTEYYENGQGHLPENADEGISRTFSEKVTGLPHKFTINIGGVIQPRMNWISMNLEGNQDPVNQAPLGYSDGIDKGDGDYIPMMNYDIGAIISIGKSISLSTTPSSGTKAQLIDGRIVAGSNGERGNEGGGKVEVQNDVDDIVKFSSGFGTLEVIINLGSVRTVGGVRVDSFKEHWDDYFPESISVETAVDNTFTLRASDAYHSAKYAHNLYPVAWTLPANAHSKHTGRFPNYGLLSNYTFIPFEAPVEARYIKLKIKEQNHNGAAKGLILSELHVYDKLIANQWSPKLKHAQDLVVVDPVISTVELEAEAGNLSAPMVTRNDNKAFEGNYITNDYGSGQVTYTFEVESAGTYAVWGRHIAENDISDSFFVRMDNGTEDIWDISHSDDWKWSKVNGRSLGGVQSYNLNAGTHTLVIRGREGGAKLDRIVITNDDAYVPPQDPQAPVFSTIELEGESGTVINPMVIRADGSAFGGNYITNDHGNGQVTYTFEVISAGVYKVFGRAVAADGVSDSFFVKMDNENEDIWDISNSNSWTWSKINGRSHGGEMSYNLAVGTHTLVIRAREGGAKLDKLIITNDSQYIPNNPPLNGEILEIEAENALLTKPMTIRDDVAALGAKYITTDYGSGSAEFTFNITQAGLYKLEGRYIAPNGTSDSFFVKMDDGIEDIWDLSPNTDIWNVRNVSGRFEGDVFIYNLTSGSHTFTLRGREGGAKLDKLTLVKQ